MNFDTFADYLQYDDGILYWKKKPCNRVKVGDRAGSNQGGGYIGVTLLGKRYPVHKIVYALHHNEIPEIVDHIDGNRKNNKIENLRACNRSQNNRNTSIRQNNKSGCKNVTWHPQSGKWRVIVRCNKKPYSFGLFEDLELADLVATEARIKLHKEFASHR